MANFESGNAPKGWIKLKTTKRTIYFDASRIAALGDVTNATALAAGAVTAVYTVGAETDVLYVCDSIDEIIEKIEKASQEQENEYYASAQRVFPGADGCRGSSNLDCVCS